MPFSSTASLINTDMDNMLRGINRDNADHALTNTVTETTLASVAIGAGTVGATGALHVIACGTLAGVNNTKTMRLKFGGTTIATITQAAGTTSDWYFDAWMYNTASNAQRWFVQRNGNDVLTDSFDYTTSAIDTASVQTLLLTGQLANVGDTITQTMWDVFVIQIQ